MHWDQLLDPSRYSTLYSCRKLAHRLNLNVWVSALSILTQSGRGVSFCLLIIRTSTEMCTVCQHTDRIVYSCALICGIGTAMKIHWIHVVNLGLAIRLSPLHGDDYQKWGGLTLS